jgi:hypothetical protein
MKTINRFICFSMLALVAVTSLAFGQTTGRVSLQTNDGTIIKGRVMAQSDDDVTVESAIGIVTLKKAQLTAESLKGLTLSPSDELAVLRERIAQQEKIITALQSENQALRSALANQPNATVPTPVTTSAVTTGASPVPPATQALNYWMSSTGKRHNSNCRYFGVGKGHPCGAQEGVACKICGG